MEPSLVLYFDHWSNDTVLYNPSNQAIWELVILWVRNIFSGHFATRLRGFAAQFLSPSFLCQQAAL